MKETAYLLQAVLICMWWIGLAVSARFFEAFQFQGISSLAFWSLMTPDLVVIAGLSLVRAYDQRSTLEYLILGAFGYAALYCCHATFLTQSGFLPTGLMLMGLAYNVLLCYDRSFFRTTASTRLSIIGIKTAIQVVCIWFLTLVVIPFVILEAFDSVRWPTVGLGLYAGCGAFLGFSLLGLTSAYTMVRVGRGTPLPMDQASHLVVTGPYRYVRNPMAVAGIGQGLSVAMMFQSMSLLVYALLGAVIWHLAVRPIEERDLAARFGDAYQSYRQRVRCWIPSFPSDRELGV